MDQFQKHRLIVLTDISSLTPGVREPDDGQSMVRLMLYTNEIDIEGLIATSNMRHGQVTRPELIEQVVLAYQQDRPGLIRHDPNFPEAKDLLSKVKAGQPVAGPAIPFERSIGKGKDTPASDWIAHVVDQPDSRPLWVAVWGGTADLAQALWLARQERTEADLFDFLQKLRIHAIADQDSTAAWIKAQFPQLFYITRTFGFRGMYRGGDTSLSSSPWVQNHIKPHGALGELYPDYSGGDIWSRQHGGVTGIKEGDTPSYLGFIQNGLNPRADPIIGDWGGRCQVAFPNRFIDAVDRLAGYDLDLAPEMATFYRWRPAFQADFAARIQWCTQDYIHANHAPRPRFKGEKWITLAPGDTITLDASNSFDPDGDSLVYQWSYYREASKYAGEIIISAPDSPITDIKAVSMHETGELHILLTLTDRGEPPLSSYCRFILKVDR